MIHIVTSFSVYTLYMYIFDENVCVRVFSQDNGVKFVDTLGEMLIPEWEEIATNLGNVR